VTVHCNSCTVVVGRGLLKRQCQYERAAAEVVRVKEHSFHMPEAGPEVESEPEVDGGGSIVVELSVQKHRMTLFEFEFQELGIDCSDRVIGNSVDAAAGPCFGGRPGAASLAVVVQSGGEGASRVLV